MQSKRIAYRILMFVGLTLSFLSQASAQQKHALLIGINDYQNITALEKAVGDAQAMADTMTKLGFKVTLALNPDRRTLNKAITTFRAAIAPGDTAFVHYSGHGIEINGQNFLLPADIPKPNAAEQDLIESESLSLNTVINRIASSGAAVRIFVIDACRDNPFAKEGTRSIGGTRGLAEVKTTAGTFIFYSAGFGQTALDRLSDSDTSPTSVYTRVLIQTIVQPFSHIGSVARRVRQKVEQMAKSIGHTQFPAYYDELSGDYCLVCGGANAQIANNSNNPNAGTGIPPSGANNSNIAHNSHTGQNRNPTPAPPSIKNYADLIVKKITLSPTGQCKAGRPIMNSSVIVQNIGNAIAGSNDNPIIVNLSNTLEATKGWGNGSKLGVIPPNKEATAYFPLFFLKDHPQLVNGLHEFKVTIDPKNTIQESNKQNNIGYKEIAFSCPLTPITQSAENSNIQNPTIIPQRVAPARNLPRGGPKSFWDHSGSLMYLKADGNKRAFFYKNPRRILKAAGIRDGSLLFHGKVAGGNYIGKMRKFSKRCGTIEFSVHGMVNNDKRQARIIFNIDVPTRNIRTCKITGSKYKKLSFTFLYSAKNPTIKPLNPRLLPNNRRILPLRRRLPKEGRNQTRPFAKKSLYRDRFKQKNPRFTKQPRARIRQKRDRLRQED